MQASKFPFSHAKATLVALLAVVFSLLFGIAPATGQAHALANPSTRPYFSATLAQPEAASYYVSPTGSPNGNGSITNPWDMQTAFNQPSSVQPGDTIWLRGGTYRGTFISSLSGSTSAPIIVRQYPAERATIDANGATSPALTVNGHDTWYWGFEVMDSNPSSDGECGLNIFGPNTRFINMVVHDNYGNGFGLWREATNAQIYGSLSYYNGRPAYRAYGVYTQNVEGTGTKTIQDNLLINNASYGLHGYGSGSSTGVSGYVIDGNTMSNGGVIGPNGDDSNLLIGGGAPTSYITLTNNYLYKPSVNHTNLYMWLGDNPHNLVMQGNYVAGGAPAMRVDSWVSNVTIRNNTFYSGWYLPILTTVNGQTPGFVWNNNSYYHDGGDPTTPFWKDNTTYDISNWRAATSFDTTSGYTNARPSGAQVFVRPNQYEAGRANITVYNWAHAGSVQADVSGILQVGQSYEVRNAQDFYAPPVLSGTYNGGSLVLTLPMNGLSMAQPSGMSRPAATGPEFNIFVLVPTSSAPSSPTPTPPSVATSTRTSTPVLTSTPTNTRVPANTATSTPVPPTYTATPASTTTASPTQTFTATPASTSTAAPTQTFTPTPQATNTPGSVSIPEEAEAAQLVSPMRIYKDSNASGSRYIASSTAESGTAQFTFSVPTSGDYRVWARVLASAPSQDSFYVSADGGGEDVYDAAENTWSSQWQWTLVNGRGGTGVPLTINPRLFSFGPGTHTITFRGREANTKLDRIIITNDASYIPTP